jgi:hypothetical protein
MKNNSSNGIGAKQSMLPDLELLTPKEAAGFLRLSESFLAKARMRGDGPRYRKLSRSVRYLRADLLLWRPAARPRRPNGFRTIDRGSEDKGTAPTPRTTEARHPPRHPVLHVTLSAEVIGPALATLWSQAWPMRRPSDQHGTSRPGSGSCRSSTQVGQGQAQQYQQARRSLFAQSIHRRRTRRHPLCQDPWHPASALAYGTAGAAADQGRRHRARQQDRQNG